MQDWLGKPYYSLDAYCKNTFHHKCYKIALNAHMTCPNRDGSLGTRGCIFCSAGGSGEFAASLFENGSAGSENLLSNPPKDISRQLEYGLSLFGSKKTGEHFIAYFQAYTNTYAPIPYLEGIYRSALEHPLVCGISIATRPDCLGEPVMELLKALKAQYHEKFIWVELGLQTIHPVTAEYIRRGYEPEIFEKAFLELSEARIPAIVHVILGLPGETYEMQLETIDYLNRKKPFGVKLQLLHILKNTDLADEYHAGRVPVLNKEEYLELLVSCLAHLDPGIVIHRVTGDGKAGDLIAPDWSRNKRDVLNSLHRLMKKRGVKQGDFFENGKESFHDTGFPDPL